VSRRPRSRKAPGSAPKGLGATGCEPRLVDGRRAQRGGDRGTLVADLKVLDLVGEFGERGALVVGLVDAGGELGRGGDRGALVAGARVRCLALSSARAAIARSAVVSDRDYAANYVCTAVIQMYYGQQTHTVKKGVMSDGQTMLTRDNSFRRSRRLSAA
jgi:hypothetical protein